MRRASRGFFAMNALACSIALTNRETTPSFARAQAPLAIQKFVASGSLM